MRIPIRIAMTALVTAILLSPARIAEAAEIKVLCAIGMQQLMENLGPKFERATGHQLAITFATLGPALKRVQGGETFDVVWLPRAGIETLVKEGKAIASSTTSVAVTQMAILHTAA